MKKNSKVKKKRQWRNNLIRILLTLFQHNSSWKNGLYNNLKFFNLNTS